MLRRPRWNFSAGKFTTSTHAAFVSNFVRLDCKSKKFRRQSLRKIHIHIVLYSCEDITRDSVQFFENVMEWRSERNLLFIQRFFFVFVEFFELFEVLSVVQRICEIRGFRKSRVQLKDLSLNCFGSMLKKFNSLFIIGKLFASLKFSFYRRKIYIDIKLFSF